MAPHDRHTTTPQDRYPGSRCPVLGLPVETWELINDALLVYWGVGVDGRLDDPCELAEVEEVRCFIAAKAGVDL